MSRLKYTCKTKQMVSGDLLRPVVVQLPKLDRLCDMLMHVPARGDHKRAMLMTA